MGLCTEGLSKHNEAVRQKLYLELSAQGKADLVSFRGSTVDSTQLLGLACKGSLTSRGSAFILTSTLSSTPKLQSILGCVRTEMRRRPVSGPFR